MFVYQMVFSDLEKGLITHYVRNARAVTKLKRDWAKRYPMRELLIEERVEIPDKKDAFIDWLNNELAGDISDD